MEAYLKITYLNDFIFCPLSIYYHELYGQVEPLLFHDKPQIDGKDAHRTIDEATYSTHSNVLQGIDVYSDIYGLCGKIDTFEIDKGLLTERKKKIVTIYDGYVFQIYGQCFCLREMGYTVNTLRFWSKDDNRVYPVKLPEENPEMLAKFEITVERLKKLNPTVFSPSDQNKCSNCIYNNFCDRPIKVKA